MHTSLMIAHCDFFTARSIYLNASMLIFEILVYNSAKRGGEIVYVEYFQLNIR